MPAAKKTAKPKAPKKTAARTTKTTKAATAKKAAKPMRSAGGTDWRPAAIDAVRRLIQQSAPDAVEEVKWRKPSNNMQGVATWSLDGLLCTGETYKDKVKFTFAKGAALPDPAKVFNGIDNGATRRSIDLRQGESVDAAAFKALVREAVKLNQG